MTRRRTYTDEQKAEALALYAEVGPAEASRRTGIASGTIASWASRTASGDGGTLATKRVEHQQANVESLKAKWAERRLVMVDEIGTVAHMALAQVQEAVLTGKGRDAKDFATTMAILVDKAQLLGGDATQRQESRQLRDELLAQARKTAPTLRAVS